MIAFLPLLLLAAPAQSAAAQPLVSPAVSDVLARRTRSGDAAMLDALERLAGAGDASADEALGEILARGLGSIAADPARACRHFERISAQRGDAAHNMAQCLFTGAGRARDWPGARLFYAQAMRLGYPKSGCALGNMMIRREGGARDAAAGLALCKVGADAGDADAQTDYGGYLLTGTGTPRDPVGALRWLTEAAQQKQANAAFLLGQIYWNGDGTPRDHAVAARWLRVAYDGGRTDAAVLLAREAFGRMIVKRGGDTLVDRQTASDARGWFTIAAERDPDGKAQAEARDGLKLLDDLAAAKP